MNINEHICYSLNILSQFRNLAENPVKININVKSFDFILLEFTGKGVFGNLAYDKDNFSGIF